MHLPCHCGQRESASFVSAPGGDIRVRHPAGVRRNWSMDEPRIFPGLLFTKYTLLSAKWQHVP